MRSDSETLMLRSEREYVWTSLFAYKAIPVKLENLGD
jgi:hypothetical protein